MSNSSTIVRPTFGDALSAWKADLSRGGLPSDLIWVFDENLCFEPDPSGQHPFKLGYQTRFSPPPTDAEEVAYRYFAQFEAPVIFYRIGSSRGKSVCTLLCDSWFERNSRPQDFHWRNDWQIAFRPGIPIELEEITDEQRWQKRVVRHRPLNELDFCMTLQAVHEILAHGRVLTTYEHYALRLFGAWRRFSKAKG